MARRTQVANEYEQGKRGEAILHKANQENLSVTFAGEENYYGIKVEDGNVPEHFLARWEKIPVGKKLRANVTLNKEGNKAIYINPFSGQFTVKLSNFVAKENEPPSPVTKNGEHGTFQTFAVLYDILEGDWAGAKLYDSFIMKFTPTADGLLSVIEPSRQSNACDKLNDFMDALGLGEADIKYSENPLPEIEEQAKLLEKEFDVQVVKGWVTNIIPPFDLDMDDVDEIEVDEEESHPAL